MKTTITNKEIETLRLIYRTGTSTAFKIPFSNANQYLIPLENKGLIIREWVYFEGNKRYKEARINTEKIEIVRELLGAKVIEAETITTATTKTNLFD